MFYIEIIQGLVDHLIFVIQDKKLHRISKDDFETYRRRFRPTVNAPNLGEFNSRRVSPYLEPDPMLPQKFTKGIIYISTHSRTQNQCHRQPFHMGTRYDARNDPSWHFKNKQVFRLATIATTGDEIAEVASLDDLNLMDSDGNQVTNDLLTEHLEYLNGDRSVGTFSSVTSMHRRNQGQRGLSRLQTKLDTNQQTRRTPLIESRDRRRILDSLDRQLLQVGLPE